MKKRVFDLGLWVSHRLENNGLEYVKRWLLNKDFWGYKAHGKTREETGCLFYDDDTRDVYVPKFNVGDKFRVLKLDKTKGKFGWDDNMLNVGDVGVVGKVLKNGGIEDRESPYYSYHEDDLEPYTKTKVSMDEIAEKFNCNVEDLEITKE